MDSDGVGSGSVAIIRWFAVSESIEKRDGVNIFIVL